MASARSAPDPDEPLFHADWERKCFALTLAAGFTGEWNIDASRFAREQMAPAEYLSTGYYVHWLHGLEYLLADRNIGYAERDGGRPASDGAQANRPNSESRRRPQGLVKRRPQRNARAMLRLASMSATGSAPPTSIQQPIPALPRYARGKVGMVELLHGTHVFPDTNSQYAGEAPQHLYTVRFHGIDLWGPDAEPGTSTLVDLWESYLDAA